MIENILHQSGSDEYELWLTGGQNFRYAVYPEYKANRSGSYRPKWEKETKQHMRDKWQANTTDGIEADDMLGIRAGELGDKSILIHLDKDINQIPGLHYNWELTRKGTIVREWKKYYVTPEEGNYFFYYQLLIGDPTDNIKGVSGIGPKKAEALLGNYGPHEWYEAIRDCYTSEEELYLNAQCLYIWRKHNDSWRNLIAS
jgi:DNA polymerase-1